MTKRKITCITGTRADYPRVRSVLKEINNREDLADLSVDELLEMIELSKEDAGKIIMDAREPWFNQD